MGKKIFLTAGHHNNDPGAIGNGYQENQLNIQLRNLTANRIKALDPTIEVWMDDDRDTLRQVIAKINKLATNEDFLLEYHFDSSIAPKASGCTSLVAKGARKASLDFGNELCDLGSKILNIPNRGVKSEEESHRGRLGILHTACSSVLFEVGFISNPSDMVNYQEWKEWLADDFARIIIKRLK